MMLVSARSPAQLVGLIGAYNAGKTSLLTAIFAHFSRTGTIDKYAFAGSFSLGGWLSLERYTRWPAAPGPTFPPHTPDSDERVPSLLHLAFRSGCSMISDLLFADAPGEWFTRWVRNQGAEDAKGACWIVDHAHSFLFFVDREGLAGADVGLVRHNTLSLARLLSEQRRGRPVVTVWTKSDRPTSQTIEEPIRSRLLQMFGEHRSFNVSVEDPKCLLILATLLAENAGTRPLASSHLSRTASAFLAYRAPSS